MPILNQESGKIEKFKKVRRIKTTQLTDHGVVFTNKNPKDGFVEYESLTEEGLCYLLDHDPNCIFFESQPVKIPNQTKKGAYYIPDFITEFIEGKKFIFDVKHYKYFEKLMRSPKEAEWWNNRVKIVSKYCEENSLGYQIVTDHEIRNERLANVQFFLKNKREPEFFTRIQPFIEDLLNENDKMSRIELAIKIFQKIKLDVKKVIPVIDHLVYLDFFLLDFETRVDDNTILMLKSAKSSKLIPLYQYLLKFKKSEMKLQPPTLTPSQKDPNYDDLNQREFLALSDHTQKEVLHRIDLLKIFKIKNSTIDLREFALKSNISVASLYNWKKPHFA